MEVKEFHKGRNHEGFAHHGLLGAMCSIRTVFSKYTLKKIRKEIKKIREVGVICSSMTYLVGHTDITLLTNPGKKSSTQFKILILITK